MKLQELKDHLVNNSSNSKMFSSVISGIRHSYLENAINIIYSDKPHKSEDTHKLLDDITDKHANLLFNLMLYSRDLTMFVNPQEFNVRLFLLPSFEQNSMIFGIFIYQEKSDQPLIFSMEDGLDDCNWGLSIFKETVQEIWDNKSLGIYLCKDTFILESKLYSSNNFNFNPPLIENPSLN